MEPTEPLTLNHPVENPAPASAAERHSDSLVIIPMYNEKENAAAIIEAVLALPVDFDVLVVDDNSPDGSAGRWRSNPAVCL